MFVIFRDSVEWDTEQEEAAQQKINENSRVKLGEDQQSKKLCCLTYSYPKSRERVKGSRMKWALILVNL